MGSTPGAFRMQSIKRSTSFKGWIFILEPLGSADSVLWTSVFGGPSFKSQFPGHIFGRAPSIYLFWVVATSPFGPALKSSFGKVISVGRHRGILSR